MTNYTEEYFSSHYCVMRKKKRLNTLTVPYVILSTENENYYYVYQPTLASSFLYFF